MIKILNERPEGMSFEHYKIHLREQKKLLKKRINKGLTTIDPVSYKKGVRIKE